MFMKEFKKQQGMIFDFNGVLWWDTELQEQAWREYAEKLRGTPVSEEEMHIHMHGRNNKYFLEYILDKEIKDAEELENLTQGKEKVYRQMCLDQRSEFKLSPGAENYLDKLVEMNIPRTIATASEINNVKFFFENLNLDKWFSLETVVYDNGIRPGKPAPDIYQDAASVLGLNPQFCMVIEDAVSGIEAANAAGIGWIIGLGPKSKWAKLESTNKVNQLIVSLSVLNPELLFI